MNPSTTRDTLELPRDAGWQPLMLYAMTPDGDAGTNMFRSWTSIAGQECHAIDLTALEP